MPQGSSIRICSFSFFFFLISNPLLLACRLFGTLYYALYDVDHMHYSSYAHIHLTVFLFFFLSIVCSCIHTYTYYRHTSYSNNDSNTVQFIFRPLSLFRRTIHSINVVPICDESCSSRLKTGQKKSSFFPSHFLLQVTIVLSFYVSGMFGSSCDVDQSSSIVLVVVY